MAIFKDISAFEVKYPVGNELIQVSPTEAVTIESIATLKSGAKGFTAHHVINQRDNSFLGFWAGSEANLPADRDESVVYFTV